MGVQGLWELLAPVGRRVSVETLAGKKVAIDASIWLVQFIKAMRDERGEMVRNAHLLGFFRRICKLLFLRTRPVFVFDGGTPALKRRTIAARRRQRENAAAKIRKTAEKLLLNHLKAKKLEELAAEIKDRVAEDDLKGKRVIDERIESEGMDNTVFSSFNQEELDEMLAASIAAEEEGMFIGKEETSTSQQPGNYESDYDESEELAIPLGSDRLDPAVLASLPPSMQLDLLVQMRERLMAENRQKYQKIKKSPSKFSELQIQSYLKTVAFRRDIDQVQRVAAGKGPEGLQSFRIASEVNREFVFSSSFSGDKRKFNPTEGEKTSNGMDAESGRGKAAVPEDSSRIPLPSDQRSKGGSAQDFGPDVETYRDERGRMRVSRVRGLGMRMTRDLQHNLDVILKNDKNNSGDAVHQNDDVSVMEATPMEVSFSVDGMDGDDEIFSQLVTGKSMVQNPPESFSLGKDSASDSEVDWEEQPVVEKSANRSIPNENDGLDWEDGEALTGESVKFAPRELSEEESQIQEAIRRSLEDFSQQSRKAILLQEHPAAGSSTIAREINGHGGLLDGESEIQLEAEGTPKNFEQQSPSGTLPCDSSPISRQDDVPGCLEEEESESQETIKRNLDDGNTMKDFPVGLQEGESEITEEIKRNIEDSNRNPLNKTQNLDSSSKKNEIDSSQISVLYNKPTSTPQIVLGIDQLISSPEGPPTNAAGLDELVGDKDVSKHFSVYESKNGDNDVASTNKISTAVLDKRNSGINDGAKVHGSPSRNPEKFITGTDEAHEIAPEEEYKHVSSVHQNVMFDKEAIESELGEELSHLNRECKDLGDQQRKLERNAESVSGEMFAECQELLQMFGLPFIIAPMEAEAQCAYMEMMNLVDGIVTDDSDAFLFGAQNVYKNIFDDRKYVETYLMKDIESELGLTREKLIHMALLLGSDYTEGVSGIGIVNAIEVVHAFPEEDGLREFREWVESPDPSIFGKLFPHIGDDAKKNCRDNLGSSEGDKGNGLSDVKMTFMEKHRNVSKNWHIPSSFPSGSVISAYISPQIDASTDPFSWGKPDLPLLRRLCWDKFGWAHQKADEVLVPVLKEYNKHETQLRMEAFYTFNERFAKIRSQRIKRAVKGITGKGSKNIMMDPDGGSNIKRKKRKSSPEALEKENREAMREQKSGRERGRGRRGRGSGAGRGRKSMEVEDGGTSDSSDCSTQECSQVDAVSSSSLLRRSTRQRVNISKETLEVNLSDEESQLSPGQPSTVQEGANDPSASYLQDGGGFCLDDDESQLSPGQPKKGDEEDRVEKEERDEIPNEEVVGIVGSGNEVGREGTQSANFQGAEGIMDFSFTPMSSLRRKRR